MKQFIVVPIVLVMIVANAACGTDSQSARPFVDHAAHSERFVTVAPDVRLHYLDFGGAGQPIVLLAGAGNSAHVFDDFAPRLTDHFRVLALTRRGCGQSSQPAAGYDSRTLAQDIRALLDDLAIDRVALVGHSIAGVEMTQFANDHPSRLAGLVYLDAAFDRADWPNPPAVDGPVMPSATDVDYGSPAAYNDYLFRTQGVRFPEAELHATGRWADDGHYLGDVTPPEIGTAFVAGTTHHLDYGRVRARALGLYTRGDDSVAGLAPWLSPGSSDWTKAETFLQSVLLPYLAAQRTRFATEVADSTVVTLRLPHYLFLAAPEVVESHVESFLLAR